MRSVDLLSRGTPAASATRELLVLWQHPTSREIVPIGRFARDGEGYVFYYTRAAGAIEGFRPLPGLMDLRGRYRSDHIPAVFNQRVMDADRPDFAEYMNSIGLDPASATPWEQIVESGGSRAGDTLQFMQVPVVAGSRARARFFANGVRHVHERELAVAGRQIRVTRDQQEVALRALSVGDKIRVEAEDENPTDPCACLVTTDGIPIGWVPKALSNSVRALLDAGPVGATVVRIGNPTSPAHLRLVLDLEANAPDGFEFDSQGLWEPFDD